MTLAQPLLDVLLPAYAPCSGFKATCRAMRWVPHQGHVPRGFCGAAGRLDEVRLVLVCAEPGDPHDGESHAAVRVRLRLEVLREWKGPLRRNFRKLLDECWPGFGFQERMRRTWTTESALCSAERETAEVHGDIERACADRFLLRQLSLFPGAVVVALGGKANGRLRRVGFGGHLKAFALAPPGCNYTGARPSWQKVAAEARRRVP